MESEEGGLKELIRWDGVGWDGIGDGGWKGEERDGFGIWDG